MSTSTPKPTVAVIGASADRSKYSNKSVRAHARAGYEVFPVHPRETTIEGWPVFRSVRDVPRDHIDLVTIYLPPSVGLTVLDEVAQKSVGEVLLNPGADAPEVIAKAKSLGLNVVVGCSILALGTTPEAVG